MNNKNDPDKEAAELRSLYELSVSDIENAKRRQWATTYYGLLTLAAVTIFYNMIKPEGGDIDYELKLLFLLMPAFGISFLCMWHIIDTHRRMCGYRMRMKEIDRKFETTTRNILCIKVGYARFGRYFMSFPVLLSTLLTLGVFFVAWHLFGHTQGFGMQECSTILCWVAVVNAGCFVLFFLYHYNRHKKSARELKQSCQRNDQSISETQGTP